MKHVLLSLFATIQLVFATEDSQTMLYMPLIMNDQIVVKAVPATIGYASPETEFSNISHPYVLLKVSPNKMKPEDINAASIAKIKVLAEASEQEGYRVTLDLKEATGVSYNLIAAIVDCCYRTAFKNMKLEFQLKNHADYPEADAFLQKAKLLHSPTNEQVFYYDEEEENHSMTRYFIFMNASGKVTRVRSAWSGDATSKPMVYDFKLEQNKITVKRSNCKRESYKALRGNRPVELNQLEEYTVARDKETLEWKLLNGETPMQKYHRQSLKSLWKILLQNRSPFVAAEAP